MSSRYAAIATMVLTLAFDSLGAVPARAEEDGAEVPMFRGNPAHTGEMPGPGPAGNPVELWRFATGDSVSSSPTVVDGVVYVGSEDGNLYAVDAASGAERWRFATGDEIHSSATVVDGVVYVGSNDGRVYAITGSQEPFTPNDWVDALAVVDLDTVEPPVGFSNPDRNRRDAGDLAAFGEGIAGGVELSLRLEGVSEERAQHITFIVFENVDQARAAFATAPVKLQRTGAIITPVGDLGSEAVVAAIATDGARATAYVRTGNVLIEAISEIDVENTDAAQLNAVDLARYAVELKEAAGRSRGE